MCWIWATQDKVQAWRVIFLGDHNFLSCQVLHVFPFYIFHWQLGRFGRGDENGHEENLDKEHGKG